jgi:endonuclease G
LYGYPIAAGARIIEYEGFVSGYDTVRLNPLWVSYNLKSQYVTGKKHLKTRKFSPDPTLAKTHTALDRDFRNSGFDRGHLARQSDMKGRSAECETEALYFTNISPQKQNFNRKTWNNLEMAVDRLAEHFGQAWIITGPYFDDDRLFINERVEIPDGFYKIVVLESERGLYPIAFVLDMDDTGMDIEQYAVTVDSIENLTKINFFHELDDEIEADFESQLFPVPYQWKK